MTLLTASLASAQTAPEVVHTFSGACPTVQPVALAYMRQRGFDMVPQSTCNSCFEGKSIHLQDASGHRLHSNRRVIETYTTRDISHERIGPFTQLTHVQLEATGDLRLLPIDGKCSMELRFGYTWYGMELVLGFPVDGDPFSGKSNGKLEAAYLTALQTQMDQASFAKR